MTSTNIEWTDEVWNPITGCSKVSQGCKNCYAERVFPRPYPGRAFTDIRLHAERLDAPLHWRKPRRVFVNSMSDLFHDDVPDEFIDRVFAVMALAPQHTFQVLTKQPRRMLEYVADGGRGGDVIDIVRNSELGYRAGGDALPPQTWPLKNVWLGVSVEDQETADYRIPLLLQTPAAVRFLSCEPLLGPMRILGHLMQGADPGRCANCGRGHGFNRCPNTGGIARQRGRACSAFKRAEFAINWVIAGGESGPQARPTHPQWLRALRDECEAATVPFFFKQWGEWVPRSSCYHTRQDGSSCADADPRAEKWPVMRLTGLGHNGRNLAHSSEGGDAYMQRVGKRAAGRLLDGREHSEYPHG